MTLRPYSRRLTRPLSRARLVTLASLVGIGYLGFCRMDPALAETPSSESVSQAGQRLFALEVQPLLAAKCATCHGEDPDDLKGGFSVLSREALLEGGETSSEVLVPGHAEKSLLLTAIRWEDPDYEMPPKENDRLTPNQITAVERWVELGAPWPDEATRSQFIAEERKQERTADGVLIETSGGLSDTWTYRRYREDELWAYQPLQPVEPPMDGIHPVDAFVRAELTEAGFEPAPPASPRSLIRRATFDLLGLPPTPEEIDRFLTDWGREPESAWSALIDRLLDSPHYGERWGQHWLDVVRYADTAGFSNDFERSNAWRYRDYVIRSFNQDKPFDRFIVEQLAGDELEPDNPELTVATGFLRMGPWGTAMVQQEVARQLYLDDVVDNVGQAFLSTPMSCCKCHDHKFDPIPTRDYYSVYATFATTQPAEQPAPFLPSENTNGFQENRELVDELWQFAENERRRLEEKQEGAARAWYAERGQKYLSPEERKNLPDDAKPPRHVGLDHIDEGTLKVREQDVRIWGRRKERFEPLAQTVYNGPDYRYNGIKLRRSQKPHPNWDPKTRILLGGAIDAPGEEVSPGALSAVPPKADVPESMEGRRLALARWIAQPENPLSTRSIVNRVWHYHFGQGLSATPNNFGSKGAKPTHPELLDWLTRDFVDHGWRFKRLHRLIMTSQTYRQDTLHPRREVLREKDPLNRLLAHARPRRLEAEALRDSLLKITGELNLEMGGLPVLPEINMEVALQPRMIQFSIAPAHQPSRMPEQRNRRTIYTYRVRGQADPFLEIFNQPNPNKSCESRDSAAVSPQAFTLLNSGLITDRSIGLALRLQRESDDLPGQIERAVELTLGRPARPAEKERLANYVDEMTAYHREVKPDPIPYPIEVTRSLVEEFSGLAFNYIERLPVYEDYVRDQKAWDVDAETRALADACLVLFNTNEFLYIY